MKMPTVPLKGDVFVPSTFEVSPLVRVALWSLYLALTMPLPFLGRLNSVANPSDSQISMLWLGLGLVGGGVLLQMVLSERVRLDDLGIAVCYPWWVPVPLRRDWSLAWSDIEDFKARSTGQGGLVYYLVSKDRSGFLLPMRIVGFSRMLRLIQIKTGIDTRDVKPLAQPWMYATLLGVAGLLAIADLWVIWTVLAQAGQG
ncbi:hypothetical protein [Altericista sp. CCNU0014]|uniref:hypothetical protein n=1 Tax=Altericista sp. CCNU0014 TaxID=3082949 RepID=UPI00385154A4